MDNRGPREAPPAAPNERRGRSPGRGFVWQTGFYNWNNGRWEWTAGHWERERRGKRWRAHNWELRGGVYVRVDGDWIDDLPDQAPPPLREERFANRRGFTWVPGHWDWDDGQYQWVAGHYERERRGKRWRQAKWEQRNGGWVRIDGDWDDDPGDVTVDVRYPTVAPPALRDERPGARGGFVWVRGTYEWRDGQYQWVNGHWERERASQRWVDGRWESRNGRWEWIAGSWETSAPVNEYPSAAPPALRDERPGERRGFVWIRGHYDWSNGQYAWINGHWERERASERWVDGRWEYRDGRWQWIDGKWDRAGYTWSDGTTQPWPETPTEGPPALRAEYAQNARGKTWLPGRWVWREGKYQWIAGSLIDARPGYRLVPGHWDLRQNGKWIYDSENWVADNSAPPPSYPSGPSSPPPAPPAENPGDPRRGFVWIRGHHEWRTDKYDWIPGHWERERARQRWIDGRWELQGRVYVWIPGSWQ